MVRALPIAVMVLLALGCSNVDRARTTGGAPCFSDIECPIGWSCDPWTRECVRAAARVPSSPSSGDVGSPDASAGPDASDEPACVAEGAACDDGDACTSADVCNADLVCGGTPYSCDDGFDCTLDSCDGEGACGYKVAAASCLIDGVCVGQGDARPSNPCQACLPSVSLHAWTNDNGGTCDDGNACTTVHQCNGGQCLGSEPPACDDGVGCTADTCDPASGCQSAPVDALCDDGVECTAEACDPTSGCGSAPDDASCDDGVECTTDTCDPTTGCESTPDDASCDDADPDTADSCSAQGCVNTPI